MPAVVAFDEAGNTGDNLLDEAQPVFCLGSVHVSESAAAALIADVLPEGRRELHFSQFRESRVGRQALLAALESPLIQPGVARVTPMHKPYAVAARFFDYVIEPSFYERGLDVYDAGLQTDFANLLYRRGPTACGQGQWIALLIAFVDLVRSQADVDLDRFMRAHSACLLTVQHPLIWRVLQEVPERDEVARRVHIDHPHGVGPRDLLDPVATSLIENCMTWPERLGRPISVLHDENAVVRRWRPVLQALSSATAREFVGPYWAERMPLPLQIADIHVVHSHTSPLVQLADLVAGAAVTWLSDQLFPAGRWAAFASQLGERGVADLMENEVWPLPASPFGRFA
jgi:hypothetical protein